MESTTSLEAAGQAWLEHSGATVRESAQRNMAQSVGRWCRVMGAERPLERITAGILAQYQAYCRDNLKASTVQLDLVYLRAFLRWVSGQAAGINGLGGALAKVRAPRPRGIRILYPEEEERILAACEKRWVRAAIVVSLETGLRGKTLMAIEWSQVGRDGWLRLRGDQLKSGQELEIPLSVRAREALERIRPRRKPGRRRKRVFWRALRTLKWHWTRAVAAAGLSGIRWHDLRRTFLTRCRQRGVAMEVAMVLSDHHCLGTVLRCYRYVDRMELLRAVGRGTEKATKQDQTST